MNQVFISWSGGKDCCLAGYLATLDGCQVRYLANTVSEDGQRSRSHGLPSWVLREQSRAIGIPLVQRRTGQDNYEAEFKDMLRGFRHEGIDGGVFGDIDFIEHRQWVERVCQDVDITAHLPLWGRSQDKILRDFISLGFEAVVVATKAELLGEEWLGRKIDLNFIRDLAELSKTREITPCGEAGEYHTLVTDGPLFQKRLEITETRNIRRDEHWFLEIQKCELKAK
ncbi:MAG: diphthine--ammonia ligase [Chloroflexi bacterium]|nr:diphthine--ammonia ligase [Chloroflexota bacterium]